MAENDITSKIKDIQSRLRSSNTAYTPNVAPTKSDISLQKQLSGAKTSLEAMRSQELKDKWYKNEDERTGEAKQGYLSNFLTGLGAPVSAVAGVAEHALGKGTKNTLLGNIGANVEERGTFGDILRSYGLSNAVSMPVGFALDIASDPLMWYSAGTSAFVPRVVSGAVAGAKTGKGIFTGIKAAAKSGALSKIESIAKFVPRLEKRTFEEGIEKGLPEAYRSLTRMSNASREEFEALTGKGMSDILTKYGNREQFTEKLSESLDKTKFGRTIKKLFGSENDNWFKEMKTKSEQVTDDILFGGSASRADVVERNLQDAIQIGKNPSAIRSENEFQNLARMRGEGLAENEYRKGVQKGVLEAVDKSELEAAEKANLKEYFKTGLNKYDKAVGKIIDSKNGRELLKGYEIFIGSFRTGKIGGNLATATINATAGNFTMIGLSGINSLNPKLFGAINSARKILYKADPAEMKRLASIPGMTETMLNYDKLFSAIYSVNPQLIMRGEEFIDNLVLKTAKEVAKGNPVRYQKYLRDSEELKGLYNKHILSASTKQTGTEEFNQGVLNIVKKSKKARREAVGEATSPVGFALEGSPATTITQEIVTGPYSDFIKTVSRKAEETGSPLWKGLEWYLQKPMDFYGKVDTSFRLGTTMHMVENGLGPDELTKLSRFYKIKPEEVTKVAGRNLWKVEPIKAMEIASKMFMNYSAMPGFVKIMRGLPIVGAPFISFQYGMTDLLGRTAMYNPAIFNKVQFALREFSGEKSPLEKEALASQYYEWMDREGMVKLPFFQENPLYLNMENMLPYYNMNLFQPSERSYDDKFGGALASFVDKFPFFKKPEGQILMDYLMLPFITGETQGMFGQQLFPSDAGALEKVARTGVAAAETVVPPLFSSPIGTVLPEKTLDYVPSFRARQLGRAIRGKSSVGADVKQPAMEKTAQVLSSLAGLPTYKINLKNK